MHSVAATATLVNMNAAPRSVVLFAKALTASDCCTSVSKGGRITIPRVAVERNLPSVADRRHHEVVCCQLRSVISLSCCSNLSITVTSKHMQVVLDAHDSEWTFVIKSWPNGGENKRVYVMEKTGTLRPVVVAHRTGACVARSKPIAFCLVTLYTSPPKPITGFAAGYMRRNKMAIGDVIAITRRPDGQLVRLLYLLHIVWTRTVLCLCLGHSVNTMHHIKHASISVSPYASCQCSVSLSVSHLDPTK